MMTTPGNPADLAKAQKFDLEKNDAELMVEIERASGQPLKKLNKDLYPIRSITLMKEPEPLKDSHLNLHKGMNVRVRINNPFREEFARGPIEGFTQDGMYVVVGGRRYSTLLEIVRLVEYACNV